MEASTLYPSKCILAEGPLWHKERKSCFWVDIESGVLYEYDWHTKEIRTWSFDYKVTLVIQALQNEVILGLNRSIARFDLDTEKLEWLVDLENALPNNRCNDGACDRKGRIWVGTMAMDTQEGAGALYCIEKDGHLQKKLENVTISNGLAWSLDNRTFYYIDTPTQKVQSFLFNEESGEIVFDKIAVQIPAEMGSPDGMAIDEEGMLWIAHYGGFGVYRWDPNTGKLLEKITVPAPNITSCAFAGENLDMLIITTASENMSEVDLKQYPGSGNIFYVKTKVKGTLPFRCTW
ncbi:MAG: SMP-30/gluconolactonase/LRE family protein [Anditalea sp.]